MKTFSYLTICLAAFPLQPLVSQDWSDCIRDYSRLQSSIVTTKEDIHVGATVYLSAAYLESYRQGEFGRVPSELIEHVYVRPASRQELRNRQVADSPYELVGADGNIYARRHAPGEAHFFRPNEAFAGDFAPHWEDPDMVLPLGLTMTDPSRYAGQPMRIHRREPAYLVLDVLGERVVFYPGHPEEEMVFETETHRTAMAEKQALAGALVGQTLLLRKKQQTFRSVNAAAISEPPISFQVRTVETLPDRVVVSGQSSAFQTLVLNAESDWEILDPDCVSRHQIAYRQQIREAAQADEDRLNANMRARSFTSATREWLAATLHKRFELQQNLFGQPEYLHQFLPEEHQHQYSYLRAALEESGRISLVSHFASAKGLYHTRVIVYVGQDSMISSRVPTLDERNRRAYLKGQVIEEVAFGAESDLRILETIARHCDEPIRVRFTAGGSYYQDTVLDPVYAAAIRDAWMYRRLLQDQQE